MNTNRTAYEASTRQYEESIKLLTFCNNEKNAPLNKIPTQESRNQFESLLPKDKEWFSPKEVASIVGKTDQYIRDSIENQKILSHNLNGRAKKGNEKRHTYIIPRDSVILFLSETANYEPVDFMDHLKAVISNRSPKQLKEILLWLRSKIEYIG